MGVTKFVGRVFQKPARNFYLTDICEVQVQSTCSLSGFSDWLACFAQFAYIQLWLPLSNRAVNCKLRIFVSSGCAVYKDFRPILRTGSAIRRHPTCPRGPTDPLLGLLEPGVGYRYKGFWKKKHAS